MRSLTNVALCLALAAAPAWSQVRPKSIGAGGDATEEEAQPVEEEGAAGSETEGAEVVDERPARGDRISPTTGGRESAPGEEHTVVRGDTLWDLSQRYLGNPWYWPKVWSYNPQIDNPHWIYPGNQVRFFPGGEERISEIEEGQGPPDIEEGQELAGGNTDAITPDLPESSPVQLTRKIGYTPRQSTTIIHTGFVTPRELEEAGTIDSSFSEALMLSAPDTMYVKFKRGADARLGDRYIIFHTETEVKHPQSLFRYGFLTKILGTARVIEVSKELVTAQIEETWDPITRDDLVGPFGERLGERISPRANDRELKGFIIGSLVPIISIMGEHHVVVVDKGSADGVQPGNSFVVVRQQDPIEGHFMDPSNRQDQRFPVEDIAVCMAVDVKERASTCLMQRSIREVVFGDRVEMRLPKTSQVSQR